MLLLLGVRGPVANGCCMLFIGGCGWNIGPVVIGKLLIAGENGDVAGATIDPSFWELFSGAPGCGIVSRRVMANAWGSLLLLELGFLLLAAGPAGEVGDACRDRLRGVAVVEVAWEL